MEKEIDFANGELSDSELLRKLAEWHESHIALGVSPDLRRIASDLEKREAPSDELLKYNEARVYLIANGIDPDKVVNDMMNGMLRDLNEKLTSALASRDYYKELAEAADKIVEVLKAGKVHAEMRYSPSIVYLEYEYEQLKNNPPK